MGKCFNGDTIEMTIYTTYDKVLGYLRVLLHEIDAAMQQNSPPSPSVLAVPLGCHCPLLSSKSQWRTEDSSGKGN